MKKRNTTSRRKRQSLAENTEYAHLSSQFGFSKRDSSSGGIERSQPTFYSDAFKLQVINDYLASGKTKNEIQKKYGIRGKSTLLYWLRKFGYADTSCKTLPKKQSNDPLNTLKKSIQGNDGCDQNHDQKDRDSSSDSSLNSMNSMNSMNKEELLAEITQLKEMLKLEQIRSAGYERMVELTEIELQKAIRKKFGTK